MLLLGQKSKNMSLLTVGTVAFDTIETPFGKAENVIGGACTYISYAASYFTSDICLSAIVGGDFPKEEIAALFKKYDLVAMPVVDNENRLVGIITIDDIVDVIEKENTEDFHKMAAIVPYEDEYLKTGVLRLAKNRILWLLILMISAMFTGRIILKYEALLQSCIALTAFIPMLMDTGGNAGSQAATLIIRGLALGEIKINDTLKIVWKEFRVAIIVGLVLSAVNFLRIYFLENADALVALTVSLSLFITVIMAKVIGCMLPIVAKKLKIDPAIMASPLITTIVDAMSLSAYFSIAIWLIGL